MKIPVLNRDNRPTIQIVIEEIVEIQTSFAIFVEIVTIVINATTATTVTIEAIVITVIN